MASSRSSGRSRQGSPIKYIEGKAAIYNNQWLPKDQWNWARDGIEHSDYYVTCKEGRNHLSFNLVPVSQMESRRAEVPKAKVSLGPEDSKYKFPTCTCPDFMNEERACRHVFWVLDNTLSYRGHPVDEDGSLSLRFDGHCLGTPSEPFYQIQAIGLASIAQAKGWTFSGTGQWAVPAQTRDMLRHFDQSTEYSASRYSDEYLSTSPDLSGAVYRLAISKPRFFTDLREEAPVDPCTKTYFRLLNSKIDRTFQRWIHYTRTGMPRLDYRDDENMSAPNVVHTSDMLRRYVYDIETAICERGPLSYDNKCRAFELLLKMLETVIDMDLNTHDSQYRPHNVEVFGETERERNIYKRLIGTYSEGYDNFAIYAMRRIPEAGKAFLPRLYRHQEWIHRTAYGEYVAEFDLLCQDIENC
ncbi:hypothetical protein TWF694_004117 [Orbilia ellipsospora]|uniref:SWIM-type domain-containing protein n=1 Tax=Orbilia ellipsospora TaxID=2528407 RepID=A0AAV9WX34_9PEZI